MIIIEDTRQQRLKHNLKRDYFRQNGIVTRKEQLSCGDYTLINDRSVVVDTKKDILELIGDIQHRSITKAKLEDSIRDICVKYGVVDVFPSTIRDIIWESDEGRYPEQEIMNICYQYGIDERAEKEFQKLYVKRRGFFHRGLKRAEHGEVKLYILVENNDNVTCTEDLLNWTNPRMERYNKILYMHRRGRWASIKEPKEPPMSGERLSKSIKTMERKYGAIFLFCKPEESGQRILELLGGSENE